MTEQNHHNIQDPWHQLTQFTDARIGIGRAGTSIRTDELLKFQLSHAQAIDAVHAPLDTAALQQQLEQLTTTFTDLCVIQARSQATDRYEYLQRPDLGRRLSEACAFSLREHRAEQAFDVSIVIADGLSAKAIQLQAAVFSAHLLTLLTEADANWTMAPIVIVEQGRVAAGDDIAQQLNANLVIVLIGERPGLSSPDSMGCYLTWSPHRGCDDAMRNCISNIRPAGLTTEDAAVKCSYLMRESRRLKLSGVNLKDRSEDTLTAATQNTEVFLIAKT